MKNKRLNYVSIAALLAATALSSTVAYADDGIDEIIVTAQKRAQSIQEVPVAITAFTGAQLKDAGFQNVDDIAAMVPSLQFQDNGIVARFSLRGINLNSISDASESPILVVTDGVPLGSSSNFASGLYDLERIEVLRGPQGTLYGRNATGGLVNLISKRPTKEFEGYASAQYGNFDKRVFEGAVGGPLSEHIRFRLSGKSDTDSGLQTNIAKGDKWWKTDEYSGRAQLEVDLSEKATILFRGHYSDMKGVGPGYGVFGNRDPQDPTHATICSDANTLAGRCVTLAGEAATTDPTKITSGNPPPPLTRSGWGTSAEINWQINDNLSLFSLSAYEALKKSKIEDADGTVSNGNTIGSANNYRQFSQEIRLQGSSKNLHWVVGGFYFWADANVSSSFGFFPTPPQDLGSSSVKTKSYAAFADGTYALSDKLDISLGGRFTREEKSHNGLNLAPLVLGFITPHVAVPFSFQANNDVATWRAVLDYKPTSNLMYYGSISTGFKAPSFNTQYLFSSDPYAAAPSKKETVTTYEMGLKSSWLQRRVIFNAAAYYTNYKGLQQVLTVPSPIGVNTPVLTNVDKAEIYGAEFDLNVKANKYFDLIGGGSYVHSKIEDPTSAFNGNVVSAAPKFSFSATGRLHIPWGDDGETALRASYRWQDKMYFGLNQTLLQGTPAYGIFNLRLTARPPHHNNVTLEAFVDNVFNKSYWVHAFGSGAIGGGTVGIWGKPRMYGGKVSVSF